MGYRLSKIYTRTGDDGTTGLGDGRRVAKDSLRIEVLGEIDELNSALGCVLTHGTRSSDLHETLGQLQHDLFEVGAELCLPDRPRLSAEQVTDLEQILDRWNAKLPPLREFVLPGGTPAAAACHLARSIARRAERSAWQLARTENLNPLLLVYLNRLSDLLFVLARALNHAAGHAETLWRPADSPTKPD